MAAGTAVAQQQTTEQKVVQSVDAASQLGGAILDTFGYNTAGDLVAEIPTMAPVFVSIFDTIKALFDHKKASAPTKVN